MPIEKAQSAHEAVMVKKSADAAEAREYNLPFRRRQNLFMLFMLFRFASHAISDTSLYLATHITATDKPSPFEVRGSRALMWTIVLWVCLTVLSFMLAVGVWVRRRKLRGAGKYRTKMEREREMEVVMFPCLVGGLVYGVAHLKVMLCDLFG